MKKISFILISLVMSCSLFGQYQKMEKASSVNLSGFSSYYHVGWSKQLTYRSTLTVSGFYFKDDDNVIEIDNYLGNIGYNRWLLKLGDMYLSGGFGAVVASTRARSVAKTKDNDVSFGVEMRAEAEFYLSWWLVFFGEVKQMRLFKSDYYNSKYVAGAGLKFIF